MNMPQAYRQDTHKFAGRFLNHDDTIDEQTLASSYEQTSQLWRSAYHENYIIMAPIGGVVMAACGVIGGCSGGACGGGGCGMLCDMIWL